MKVANAICFVAALLLASLTSQASAETSSFLRKALQKLTGSGGDEQENHRRRFLVNDNSDHAITLVSVNDDETVTVKVRQMEFGDVNSCGENVNKADAAWLFFYTFTDPDTAELTCDLHRDVDACFETTLTIACDPDSQQASINLYIRDETYSPQADKIDNPYVGNCLLAPYDQIGKSKTWTKTFDCIGMAPPIDEKAGINEECELTEDCQEDLQCVAQAAEGGYWRKLLGQVLFPDRQNRKNSSNTDRSLQFSDGPEGMPPGPGGMPPAPIIVDPDNKKCVPYLNKGNICGIFETDADCNPNDGLFCSSYDPYWCIGMGPTDDVGGRCALPCTEDSDCDVNLEFCYGDACVERGGSFSCCQGDNECAQGFTCGSDNMCQ